MSLTAEEFLDILNAEQHVDLAKLRSSARYGIPPAIRGEVWMYLLQVLSPDRTDELTRLRHKYATYFHLDHESPVSRRIASECTRYFQRRLSPRLHESSQTSRSSKSVPNSNSSNENAPSSNNQVVSNHIDLRAFSSACEAAVGTWLNRNRQAEYYPVLVHLCAPFVECLKTEAGIYYCFERLMSMRDDYFNKNPLLESVSSWINLFRLHLPDLYSTFDEEEVDVRELAMAWLPNLFAQELPLDSLMRLWDAYLAMDNPFDHHRYVCLAILSTCRETLEELDQSEVRSMMLSLPRLDISRLLAEAHNIKMTIQATNRAREISGRQPM